MRKAGYSLFCLNDFEKKRGYDIINVKRGNYEKII